MLRAYALSLGAATRTVLLFPALLFLGPLDGPVSDGVLIGAWILDLAIAEPHLQRSQV